MSSSYVPYQNQLQFNLGVPLMTQNLTASYDHPAPILVERVGGQNAISVKIPTQKLHGSPGHTDRSGANYSILSEDKMEAMSQLARRDLKNRALQMEMASNSQSTVSSLVRGKLQQRPSKNAQDIHCRRRHPQERRTKAPLTAKEADKNRRFGAVQTPPLRKPTSYTRAVNESILSQKSAEERDIFFPVKPTLPTQAHNSNAIAKLEQEIMGYLHLVEKVVTRATEECSTNFLRPALRGKQRDRFLAEEEGYERVRARVGEQNTRCVRNLYNLRQKVKQLQRDAVHADPNKPVKKTQLTAQLVVIFRGVTKSVQTFVNQLPYQDLTAGLPSHFHELVLLLRQLMGLASLAQMDRSTELGQGELLALLETIEAVNVKWCAQLRAETDTTVKREKKPVASKGWVSDTKVDKDIFLAKERPGLGSGANLQPKRPTTGAKKPQHKLGQQARIPRGKENRRDFHYQGRGEEQPSGRAALLYQQDGPLHLGGGEQPKKPPQQPLAWEVNISRKHQIQNHRKGYLLPSDLVEKRERAKRAVEVSKQRDWSLAGSTAASKLATSPRPSSAPSSPDKRVNFDLDNESTVPWVRAGSSPTHSRSRSLSLERRFSRSRSLSSERKSPFYLRNLDPYDIEQLCPERQNVRSDTRRNMEVPKFGFQSLPMDKKLRSADVSNSFVDEVEHRLLARLMGQRAGEDNQGRPTNLVEKRPGLDQAAHISADICSDTLDMTSPEDMLDTEAVSLMDAPTLETVKFRLTQMQQEQKEIRHRWSSLKFYDSQTKSKIISENLPQHPREPPALELGYPRHDTHTHCMSRPVSKEMVEFPLIFTKQSSSSCRPIQYLHTVYPSGLATADSGRPRSPLDQTSLQGQTKCLLSVKQTTAERVANERSRFENHLRRTSHHPAGKFDPWALVEQISDEILMDCLEDVAHEVESINEDIANFMYKSEFLVEQAKSTPSSKSKENEVEAQLSRLRLSEDADRSHGEPAPQRGPLRPGLGSQGDALTLSEGHILKQRGSPVDESPWGRVRASSNASDGSSAARGTALSPPDLDGGTRTGHLWRSSPMSLAGSGSRTSTPRSPQGKGIRGAGSRSPLRRSEPALDDVSHLLPNRQSSEEEGEEEEEESSKRVHRADRSGAYGSRGQDEDNDEDVSEEYSEEDFEDVTDVEL